MRVTEEEEAKKRKLPRLACAVEFKYCAPCCLQISTISISFVRYTGPKSLPYAYEQRGKARANDRKKTHSHTNIRRHICRRTSVVKCLACLTMPACYLLKLFLCLTSLDPIDSLLLCSINNSSLILLILDRFELICRLLKFASMCVQHSNIQLIYVYRQMCVYIF